MKILLVAPGWHKSIMKEHIQFPPLGLAMVAAVTPAEHTVQLIDENLDPLDFDADVDLVGITSMTCQAHRAYEISRRFRARGIPVVIGGPHPSLLSAEAAEHVDAVVVGEAEEIWPTVLEDVQRGRIQKFYQSERRPDLTKLPFPRRGLFKKGGYEIGNTVQTTRGCPFNCDFCSVTAFFGRSYRTRAVEQVVAEVKALVDGKKGVRQRLVYFVDDNIVANPNYAKALFRELVPLKIRWTSQGTVNEFTRDPELLELAAKSGCFAILIGFESVSTAGLKSINKTMYKVADYAAQIKKIHDAGIGVWGSFIFGLEGDTAHVFDETVQFAQSNAIDICNFSVLTPYPGTQLAKRFAAEGRITTTDWRQYHAFAQQVLFRHDVLSAPELLEGTERSWKTFYSWPAILARAWKAPRTMTKCLPIVLAYRRRARAVKLHLDAAATAAASAAETFTPTLGHRLARAVLQLTAGGR